MDDPRLQKALGLLDSVIQSKKSNIEKSLKKINENKETINDYIVIVSDLRKKLNKLKKSKVSDFEDFKRFKVLIKKYQEMLKDCKINISRCVSVVGELKKDIENLNEDRENMINAMKSKNKVVYFGAIKS